MLDVDRGVHIDPGREQFLHILPALGVTAAGGIAVGQLIDQYQLGSGGKQAVEVHFLKLHAAIIRAQHGLLGQAIEQGLGLGAAMGFDHPGQYFDTLAQLRMSRLQHGVGFAHAGCRAEKHFKPATACAR